MEEALPLAKNFNEAHAKFIDWIVKMEPKTKSKDTQEPEEQVMVRTRPRGCGFQPHRRHCVVVLEQDTFFLD